MSAGVLLQTLNHPAEKVRTPDGMEAGHDSASLMEINPSWVPRAWQKVVQASLLLLTVTFFALHFVHLSADFPNFSRWMDWSKYTDEGWYGDAAIRHYQLGHWYVPGDFNPAAALPVWPIFEGILFHFTGVSLVAARALTLGVFAGILLAGWTLIARSAASKGRGSLTGSVAVLLLATNPFCYVFTRLAILEPLLILLMLLALLAAQRVRLSKPLEGTQRETWWEERGRVLRANAGPVVALGLLLPLLVLTKTTGLFLVPAVAWLLFAGTAYRVRPFLQVALPAATIAVALWLGYYLLVVRPHYLIDYRYLFSANAYTKITRANYVLVIHDTIRDGRWFGSVLFPCSLAAAAATVTSFRRLKSHPLLPALLLWAGGYAAFLAYHNNLQPRYYLVVAVPLTLLVPVAYRDLIAPHLRKPLERNLAAAAAAITLLLIVVPDAAVTIDIVRHPQYTLLSAARQVQNLIERDHQRHPEHSTLLLSISGSEISLMTRLHSICDDFGTAELSDRAKMYNPGWYASWNLIEDDKMDALDPSFHVERVATFPAMDDQDRNLLVLYRLEPAEQEEEQAPTIKPRSRRNKLGQQPSPIQLGH